MFRRITREFVRSNAGSVEEIRGLSYLAKKSKMQRVGHYYKYTAYLREEVETFERMINGNDVLFFKGHLNSGEVCEELVMEYEKKRPQLVINVDNHLNDYLRLTENRFS